MPGETRPSAERSPAVVELFGGPRLSVGDRSVSLSPYQACLVGVVFGSREAGVSRSRLTHLLWEEDGPEARHRLSQLLYSLSKKPGGGELFDAGSETVAPGHPAWARDLRRFHPALDEGDLGRATDLLDRGFLSCLALVPTRAFQEWLDGARARLRADVRKVAANRWSRFSAEEAWSFAARAATVLLRLDPLDERALRNVLWSRGMAGRVHEALAEYRGFRERAEAERRVERWRPQPETSELVERLESLETAPLPPPELEHRPPESEPKLCGRDSELATLSRAVAAPGDTPLTTVLVTGEAGIGKTRLVEEAIRGARLRGYRVLRGGSSEFERSIPLNLLLDALDREHVGGALNRLEDPWRSVLLSLMPQFHRGDGPLPEVPYVEPGSLPRRTYEALRRLVVSVVSDGPVLLFLDDFQWADETSVAAVEFLRRRWNGGRFVLVLGLRNQTVPQKSRAHELAEELRASGETLHLELDELRQDAAEELIAEVAPRDLEPGERREIAALAGNNPFFTVELTHEYVRGDLSLRVEPGEVMPVPVSIRQLLERRLEGLSAEERQILDVLVVFRKEATLEEIAELTGASSLDDCAASVDRLQGLRLVRWIGRGVRIRHELIRHTVYGRLGNGRRALLHKRTARWLQGRDDTSPDELALHYDRAEMEDQALRFSLQAAERAEASGAVPEAVRFYATARRNTDDPETAAEIVGKLGHLHYLHRNLTEAAPLLDLAAERFRRQNRLSHALQAEIERIDALSRLELIPIEDFVQKVSEIKQQARAQGDWEAVAKLLDVEVHTLDRKGDVDGVRRALAETEEIADRGSPAARCASATALALNALYGSPERALEAARRALSLAQRRDLSQWRLKAANRLSMVLGLQGLLETSEGRAVVALGEKLSTTAGDRHQRFGVPANRGVWYLDIGEFEKAHVFFARALRIADEHPAPELNATVQLNLAELFYFTGKIDESRKLFREAVSLSNDGTAGYVADLSRAGLGLCTLYDGNLATARKASEGIAEKHSEWVYDRFLIALLHARLLRRRGDIEAAITFLEKTCTQIRKRFVPSWIKLKLEEARLASKIDPHHAKVQAEEGLSVSENLRLNRRARQFELLLTHTEERS